MEFHPDTRTRGWRLLGVGALALGLAGATGCDRLKFGASAAATDANARLAMESAQAQHDSLTSALAPVPNFPDAAPRQEQVPPHVMDALKGSAETWMIAWRVDLGTFRLDQLARTWTRPLAEDVEPYDGNAEGEDLRLTFLAIPGPNATTALDPYGEWTLAQQGEIVHARHDGAPAVSYIDLANHERRRVLVLPDRFARVDGAQWLDSQRFLVFAGERFEANPWSGGPVLYLVDLGRGTLTRFAGPGGDYAGFQAVGHEIDRHLRTQLRTVVFDGA